jgi:ATP-binding cassette subfamily C protein
MQPEQANDQEAQTNDIWEFLLLRLRYKQGTRSLRVGRENILLDDPETIWLVHTAQAQVFVVPVVDGEAAGARTHLFTAQPGTLLMGADLTKQEVGLLLDDETRNNLVRAPLDTFKALAETAEFQKLIARLLDNWINGISPSISNQLPPKDCVVLTPNAEQPLETGQTARTHRAVLWLSHLSGRSHWMGQPALALVEDLHPFPLAQNAWIRAETQSHIAAKPTDDLIEDATIWEMAAGFNQQMLSHLVHTLQIAHTAERERLQAKQALRNQAFQDALVRIADTMRSEVSPFAEVDRENTLLAACQLVGNAAGIDIKAPDVDLQRLNAHKDPVQIIANASHVRVRRVSLKDKWWQHDNGPLLAYTDEDKRPVALLPASPNSYELHDPTNQTTTPVTPEVAEQLAPFAKMFYRSLPDTALGFWRLITFGLRSCERDLAMILLMGLGIGALQVIMALTTAVVFDEVIPSGDLGLLVQVAGGLVVIAVVSFLFDITMRIAVIRVENRAESVLQPALWDRLLNLHPTFFRDYSAGDLGTRAMGVSQIRRIISGTVMMSVLSGLFSLFNLALLFYLDGSVALVALGFVILGGIVTGMIGYHSLSHQRKVAQMRGENTGFLLQFINGTDKFRVAGIESRVFAFWANRFSAQRRAAYQARTVANRLRVFRAVYPLLASMAVFSMIALSQEVTLSVGTFIAFNTAFVQFLSAGLVLSGNLIALLSAIPIYERAQPILQTLPEVTENKSHPGELRGEIEVNHVSFRYHPTQPLILQDVSFAVKRGSFVAIVGPSGSGKSTLLRLLLGFERPESGVINYDNQDINELDVRAVRQQIGVVLQNSKLISGADIFTNLIGNSTLTLDDAWEAARMAGFEQDIRQMPMGMHTVISEEGRTLSGGQRQRLLIAAAIVHKPRILFFDEATSALDNRTQAVVSQSLENLDASRIVIAHRLSTIINADEIIVLDGGKIVQRGTYDELIESEGLFAELAKRQLA